MQGGAGYWATQTIDSNYLFIANKENELFLTKTNSSGDTLFAKSFIGITVSTAGWSPAYNCSDGGFIITGTTYSQYYDVFLMRFSSDGNLLWQNNYGTTKYDEGFSVMENSNKEIIVTGSSNIGAGADDIFFMRTDSIGSFISSTRIFDTNNSNQWCNCVRPALDKGFILTGVNIDNLYDAIVIKSDSSGNISWLKTYGNSSDREEAKTILPLQDSTYVLLLSSYYMSTVTGWTSLIKIDKFGNIIWAKDYSKVNNQLDKISGRCVIETNDKGFLIGGSVLMKTDSVGNALWCNNKGIFISDVKQTFDNGYIIAGNGSYGYYGGSAVLLKVDSLGNGGCYDSTIAVVTTSNSSMPVSIPNLQITSAGFTVKSPILVPINDPMITDTTCIIWTYDNINEYNSSSNQLEISPNPTSGVLQIQVGSGQSAAGKEYTIEIYNVMGEKVYNSLLPQSTQSPQLTINLSAAPKGIYFIQVTSDKGRAIGKIIIQ